MAPGLAKQCEGETLHRNRKIVQVFGVVRNQKSKLHALDNLIITVNSNKISYIAHMKMNVLLFSI